MASFILEGRDIRRTFETPRGPVRVLDGVDLVVDRREVVLIQGRSGAGKSTLLSILAGLDRPTSGAAFIGGRSIGDLPGAEKAALRRRSIGLVFQSANLIPSWTARENVEAALLHDGLDAGARREKAAAILASLGLGARLHHLPSEMSAGERQRTAVARALAAGPELILADEPTGEVDPETAREIEDLLIDRVKAAGATLVIASHGTFPPERADRVLVLEGGKLRPA